MVIAPRWRKILRDLWSNKARTFLVILSIAVGVAAIGMVAGTYSVITRDLPAQYTKVRPAHAQLMLAFFSDDLVQVIRQMDGVDEAEGRASIIVRLKTGEDTWRELNLTVLPDFNNIRINKIFPFQGEWPPVYQEMVVERNSIPLINAEIGDTVLITTPNGVERRIKLVGTAHDLNNPSGTFTGQATGFITSSTLEWLGVPANYNELLITAEGQNLTPDQVRDIAYSVQDKVEKSGRTVYATTLPTPDQHWFVPYLAPMAALLSILGIIILLLSSFLIINTISATLSQQIRQIGIMKSVGARTGQVLAMYIFSMVIVGIFAFGIAVPIGWLGMRAAVSLLAGIINFDVVNYQLPRWIIILQAILSILLPVVISFFPIRTAARITIREAINDYGLTQVKFGDTWIDRLVSTVQGLSRPLMLSLRNTFRKKSRLAMTLTTLILGSAIFIAVMTVYTSLVNTLDDALNYYGFDLSVMFTREYRTDQILSEVNRVPGVEIAETWGIADSRIVNPDGTESISILFVAPPTDTQLIKPAVLYGRWLNPEDENAIVINTDVLAEKPDVKVGDSLKLKINGVESIWKIVGITRSVMTGPWIYANYPYFTRRLGKYGLASGVYIALDKHDPETQAHMSKVLDEHFDHVGLRVSTILKVVDLRATAVTQFNVIFIFLMGMSILLTIVGSLGLTGTMSLNVLERTREIGVMRSIGASNGAIYQIVITEGIIIGLISWTIGLLFSIPLGTILSNIVGSGFLRSPLIQSFSWPGAFLWLLIMVVISIIASFIPARRATRLTVRDVLAYE
jgi:putative ABC transport system permease protein